MKNLIHIILQARHSIGKLLLVVLCVSFSIGALSAPTLQSLSDTTDYVLSKIRQKDINKKNALSSVDIETYSRCVTIGTFITVQQIKFNSKFDESMIMGVATINAANAFYRQSQLAKGISVDALDNALKANTPLMLQDSNGFFMRYAVSCATKGMNLLEKLNFD